MGFISKANTTRFQKKYTQLQPSPLLSSSKEAEKKEKHIDGPRTLIPTLFGVTLWVWENLQRALA
jgi:hypothetical protein